MNDVLTALRAAGEHTRLRILRAVDQAELTVSDLCRVLGQSQPRVSRHLRLLCDAGLLVRHPDGSRAFYRPATLGLARSLLPAILDLLDPDDPTLAVDQHRLDEIRAERAEAAARYFEAIAPEWDRLRQLHVGDHEVEVAVAAAVADRPIGNLLDIGTGTGRMLELLAPSADRGLGIDFNPRMLELARAHLAERGIRNCAVRRGDALGLDVPAGSIDVAVIHHVLHFLDDPATAVTEAARTLRPGGRLLIVDFATHGVEELRESFAHRRLGFDDDEISGWCAAAGLTGVKARRFPASGAGRPAERPVDRPVDGPLPDTERLTVILWTGTKPHSTDLTTRAPAADHQTLEPA